MNRNDGGPAYPLTWMQRTDQGRGERVEHRTPGMTLRDYFAAKAMQALISNEAAVARHKVVGLSEGIDPEVLLATGAYLFADAMLAERAK